MEGNLAQFLGATDGGILCFFGIASELGNDFLDFGAVAFVEIMAKNRTVAINADPWIIMVLVATYSRIVARSAYPE